MSGDSETAQIIAGVASGQVNTYMNTATGALLAYEYLVTFGDEVNLFWAQKITMASILFIANRYIALCTGLMYLPYDVPLKSCEMFSYINSSLYHSQYIPWAVFSAMRAYALSSRTWPLAVGVFLLSLGPVVVNFVGTGYAVYESDGAACGLVQKLAADVQHDLTIVSRTTLIIADLLVLAITWKTTFKDSRENMRVLGQRTSLSAILFRDGVIYFVTLAIMNILHLSFSLLSIVNWSFHAATSSLATFSDPLTAILVSRFLIDLQEANNALMHQGSLASMDSLAFNRFVGSLGAPLPAPLAFEPPSVSENDEQPEERSGGEAQAVATLQVA